MSNQELKMKIRYLLVDYVSREVLDEVNNSLVNLFVEYETGCKPKLTAKEEKENLLLARELSIQSKFEEAAEKYYLCAEHYKDIDMHEHIECLISCKNSYKSSGNTVRYLSILQELVNAYISREVFSPSMIAKTYEEMGKCNAKNGYTLLAIENYQTAVKFYNMDNKSHHSNDDQIIIGNLYVSQENFDSASKIYEEQINMEADEITKIDCYRLDFMLNALWNDITEGDTSAIRTAVVILERRAKLMGLDKPSKMESTITEKQETSEDLRKKIKMALKTG